MDFLHVLYSARFELRFVFCSACRDGRDSYCNEDPQTKAKLKKTHSHPKEDLDPHRLQSLASFFSGNCALRSCKEHDIGCSRTRKNVAPTKNSLALHAQLLGGGCCKFSVAN